MLENQRASQAIQSMLKLGFVLFSFMPKDMEKGLGRTEFNSVESR